MVFSGRKEPHLKGLTGAPAERAKVGAATKSRERDEGRDGQAITSTGETKRARGRSDGGRRAANGQKVHFHLHKGAGEMKQISASLFPL